MSVDDKILADLVRNKVEFIASVPCKQLAGLIDKIDNCQDIHHIPSNKKDEGMGLYAGAFMGGKRAATLPTIANNVADNFILLIIDICSYGSTGDQPTYAGKKRHLRMWQKLVAVKTSSSVKLSMQPIL